MASNTLAENLIRLQEAKEDIADAIVEMGGTASSTDGLEDMPDAIRTIQSNPTLITKSITANGTYDASDDSADGYSEVTVAVPQSSVSSGTVTYTSNSNFYVESSTQDGTADGLSDALQVLICGDLIAVFGTINVHRNSTTKYTMPSGTTIFEISGFQLPQKTPTVLNSCFTYSTSSGSSADVYTQIGVIVCELDTTTNKLIYKANPNRTWNLTSTTNKYSLVSWIYFT